MPNSHHVGEHNFHNSFLGFSRGDIFDGKGRRKVSPVLEISLIRGKSSPEMASSGFPTVCLEIYFTMNSDHLFRSTEMAIEMDQNVFL